MIARRPHVRDVVVIRRTPYRIIGFDGDHAVLRCFAGERSKVLVSSLEWDGVAGVWRS